MDVHPPLAKLLITLAGWLAGFNGEFDFKDIGKDYLEPGVPYVAMRLLPALMGVLTIPTMFLTLRASGCRTTTCILGALLVIFGMSPGICPIPNCADRAFRKWPRHSIPFDPPRFPSRHLHRPDSFVLDSIHQST